MKRIAKCLLAIVAATALWSCGSASNNDQGVSFTLFGFFTSETGGTGEVGANVPLSTRSEGNQGFIATYYGLQNNMTGVGIRTQRAMISYYVEGSTIQPPDTTQAVAALMGPSGSALGSSLPPGFANGKNIAYAGVPIVPPDIMAWLNLNRASLPELPFQMTVRTYITGITTAGDRLDTNPLDFRVTFLPDEIIQGDSTSSDSSSSSSAEAFGDTTTDILS